MKGLFEIEEWDMKVTLIKTTRQSFTTGQYTDDALPQDSSRVHIIHDEAGLDLDGGSGEWFINAVLALSEAIKLQELLSKALAQVVRNGPVPADTEQPQAGGDKK